MTLHGRCIFLVPPESGSAQSSRTVFNGGYFVGSKSSVIR